MKASDTVIKTNEENCHNTLEERLAEQAELSFKAGIKEVVELLKPHIEKLTIINLDLLNWSEVVSAVNELAKKYQGIDK